MRWAPRRDRTRRQERESHGGGLKSPKATRVWITGSRAISVRRGAWLRRHTRAVTERRGRTRRGSHTSGSAPLTRALGFRHSVGRFPIGACHRLRLGRDISCDSYLAVRVSSRGGAACARWGRRLFGMPPKSRRTSGGGLRQPLPSHTRNARPPHGATVGRRLQPPVVPYLPGESALAVRGEPDGRPAPPEPRLNSPGVPLRVLASHLASLHLEPHAPLSRRPPTRGSLTGPKPPAGPRLRTADRDPEAMIKVAMIRLMLVRPAGQPSRWSHEPHRKTARTNAVEDLIAA
ncbi:hypothetical protein GA0115254_111519 [Streptomyces sp. Ncost-T10-10d]|nr:hypothetical protein GA0115254_111519 [Streptomyces sp. Ncost-T10-10d]